jgi:hypothetical protein
MKKTGSPPSIAPSLRHNIKQELQKPFQPLSNLFSQAQEQQEKKTANSIKKILKELTDLKKELKDIKGHNSRTQAQSQGLDMSVCRKLSQDKKSPSPEQNPRSHSSSRKRTSNTKEISTQTKAKRT